MREHLFAFQRQAILVQFIKVHKVARQATRSILYYEYKYEVNRMMMIERQADQLALSMNLCTLLGKQENYQLTNEIILEYVGLLSEKRLEDMLEYTTRELRSEV